MSPPEPPSGRQPFPRRFLRFLRSSTVGLVATLADFAVLEICVRLLHVRPSTAKVFSFLVGLSVQFLGNRTFAFHATGGPLGRQVLLFCAVESVALTLNWLLFRYLAETLGLPLELANVLVTFVVYVGFSYPAWRIVFRVRQKGGGAPEDSSHPS